MKYLAPTVVVVASVFLVACVSEAPPASPQEKDAAIRANLSCLAAAARKYDDRISDASSVAAGIMPMCHSLFQATIDVHGRGMTPRARAMFEEMSAPDEKQSAIGAILAVRAQRQ